MTAPAPKPTPCSGEATCHPHHTTPPITTTTTSIHAHGGHHSLMLSGGEEGEEGQSDKTMRPGRRGLVKGLVTPWVRLNYQG